MKRKFYLSFIFGLMLSSLYAKEIPVLDFSNQKITDILLVLADIAGETVVSDESVLGNASFHFSGGDFESSLSSFLTSFNLWYLKKNGIYYVSRIHINVQDNSLISIDAEDVTILQIVKALSKQIETTILYDQLPSGAISIHARDVSIQQVLEMLVRRNWEYEVISSDNYFYIQKNQGVESVNTRFQKVKVTKNENLYSISAPKATFSDLIKQLFVTADKEYSLLIKTGAILENVSYTDKEFDQLLRLILDLVNADFVEQNGTYYIIEGQKKDVLKRLKSTEAIPLQNIQAQNALALMPSVYDVANIVKIDKNSNTLYITGTEDEIRPIRDFLKIIDIPVQSKTYERFDVKYITASEAITLIPQQYFSEGASVVPGTNSFITMVTAETSSKISEYLRKIDIAPAGYPIRLKYIKSSELIKNLPPSVRLDEIKETGDDTLIFYTGTDAKRSNFVKNLELIDVPVRQIRYELFIVQYQKSDNLNWNKTLSVSPTESSDNAFSISGSMSELFNINFDVISQFGYQFAADLNLELGESKAKVLADTTLHGISGTDVKFENTNTFRYNEGVLDSDSSSVVVTTTTKEITSGLKVTINGWVSGDGMITMSVDAEVSKQGTVSDSSSDLPPTSEKSVTSQIRTKSGTPIIIGGLLQTEISENVKKTPLLGSIPVIGKFFQNISSSEENTEMVIYIVPHVFIQESEPLRVNRNIERFHSLYVSGDM